MASYCSCSALFHTFYLNKSLGFLFLNSKLPDVKSKHYITKKTKTRILKISQPGSEEIEIKILNFYITMFTVHIPALHKQQFQTHFSTQCILRNDSKSKFD